MFIVFNKEYRKFEAIMSDLLKKMKKSANIRKFYEKTYEENAEIYKLDTIDIVFDVSANKLVAKDKGGNEIVVLDCHYDIYDELQNAKWNLFGDFLEKVRNTYDKRIEKANKLKEATEKAKKAQEVKQKAVFAQLVKDKILNDALEKLRGL